MASLITTTIRHYDRREKPRFVANVPVQFRYKTPSGNSTIEGISISLNEGGVSCKFEQEIPHNISYAYVSVAHEHLKLTVSGKVKWVSDDGRECGLEIDNITQPWEEFVARTADSTNGAKSSERRKGSRRENSIGVNENRRKSDRRFANILLTNDEVRENVRLKKFLRSKATGYSAGDIRDRREWVANLTRTRLHHLSHFSEAPEEFRGKIESPIGVAHVPVGIAGPLHIKGEHARGIFFVPMATTEGALITSYTFGSSIVTRSGGIKVKILKNALKSDPTFVFQDLEHALSFVKWIEANFKRIQEIGERTSHHLKLLKIEPILNGRRVILSLHFYTGDAMGMNMAYKATDVICKWIKHSVRAEEFWLHSNLNSIKKTSGSNFITGYGRTVTADVTIPRKVLKMVNTTPEKMERYFLRTLLGSAQGILFGVSAHMANAMTAISIACGQDAALVANTHNATITCEVKETGDLYYSATFPCVFAATVGGGTSFGTSRECLEILGCYGDGKADKLAEIIAATALAGEISLMTSVVNGTYINAHETFGRNRPT